MPTANTDIASAAQLVATRFEAAKRAGHTDVAFHMEEVIALLHILGAVAAGQSDEGRLERWARGLDPDLWAELDLPVPTRFISAGARDASLKRAAAAMAVADAERVAADGWRSALEVPPDGTPGDVWAHGGRIVNCYYNRFSGWRTYADGERDDEEVSGAEAWMPPEKGPDVAALDAAVRRFAGVKE